jgi:hypothetical protein
MRSLIAITASVAMVMAQVPVVPAYAETTSPAPQVASQNSVIAATFKAFPSGGEALSMRIADLIAANPKLATELVIYMRNAQGLNRAQKVAAEHGLATAADRLGIQARQACPPNAPANACCPDGTWRFERWPDGTLRDVGCDDLWFIALGILAVAAAACAAACGSNSNNAAVVPHPQ